MFEGLMDDFIEYPLMISSDPAKPLLWSAAGTKLNLGLYRVIFKANGNFARVMEHTAGNDSRKCELVEEETTTTKASDIIVDDTLETTCVAMDTTA